MNQPQADTARSTAGMLQVALWILLLSMFFQIFAYKQEAGPLYALAKGWPLLTAPLMLYAIVALRLPDTAVYLVLLVHAFAVTPFLSLLYLPNSLLDAAMSTVKAWPLTFYFAAAAALILLRPSERLVARVAIGFGIGTYLAMLLLWMVIPEEWYGLASFGPNMFSWDEDRLFFIRMPLMLGEVALFWLGRRFIRDWKLWQLALILGALVSMVIMYKSRLPISVSVILLTLMLLSRLPSAWRWGLGALATVPAVAAAMVLAPGVPDLLASIFNESLFIRLRSVSTAWDWITGDPIRLLLGSGSISNYSEVSFSLFLRTQDFWLADIGWLGVLMEFGLFGTVLLVFIHARALIDARAIRAHDSAFRDALGDYVLFEILCSAVYSVMFAPGPVVTVAAIAWWLKLRDEAGIAEEVGGWPAREAPEPVVAPAWAQGHVSTRLHREG